MEKSRLKGIFLASDNRGGGDYTVGRVVRLERSGEILGANFGECDLGQEALSIEVILTQPLATRRAEFL